MLEDAKDAKEETNAAPVRDKIAKKIIEILGLETDINGNENMFLIRNKNDEVVQGIDFTDEVIELVQFFEDNLLN